MSLQVILVFSNLKLRLFWQSNSRTVISGTVQNLSSKFLPFWGGLLPPYPFLIQTCAHLKCQKRKGTFWKVWKGWWVGVLHPQVLPLLYLITNVFVSFGLWHQGCLLQSQPQASKVAKRLHWSPNSMFLVLFLSLCSCCWFLALVNLLGFKDIWQDLSMPLRL